MAIIDTVLAAAAWSDLPGYPRDARGLRRLQRELHPDVNPDPRAADAFARIEVLFNAPDVVVHLARGRKRSGAMEWDLGAGNEDLAATAVVAARDVLRQPNPDGSAPTVQWVPTPAASGHVLTSDYGPGWWLLTDFPALDAATAAWVWNRLLAVISMAERAGWIHGDIAPGVIALDPAEHGLRLDGWWTAVRPGHRLVVAPTSTTPPAYKGGKRADAQLSLAQAASSLLERSAPSPKIKNLLLQTSLRPAGLPKTLKHTRGALHADFGRRAWHELAAPSAVAI